jgi:3-oxoacyl-[acyl-carrier protein] reductase
MLGADLIGKSVLLTGGGSGIGAGIAKVFAAAGAHVVIADINAAAAEVLAMQLDAEAIGIACDVSDPRDVARAVEQAEAWHKIDVLVNCAGIAGEIEPLARQSIEGWQQVIDVNLKGTYLMCKAVAERMRGRRSGAIVNIASITGLTGFPGANAYGVSKAGVIMMTQTLATELARFSIRVNAVAPGMIDAPMLDHMTSGKGGAEAITSRVPMGRVGTPREIGNAVLFLASDAASYVTGTTLPVDGGWLAFGGAGAASRGSVASP